MSMLIRILLLCLLATPAFAKKLPYDKREIDVDGDERKYLLETIGESDGPRPALVVLHGGGGSPEQIREHAAFTIAEEGWAVIYPRAIGKNWNDGRTGVDGAALRETKDVEFFRSIVVSLAEEGVINPTKVFFTGISNGGMMTLRVLCDAPELVAGAAIVAATHPVGLYCVNLTPVPMVFFHGTEDEFVPFYGGRVAPKFRKDRGEVSSAAYAMDIAAQRNGCSGYHDQTLSDEDLDDGTQMTVRTYDLCAQPLTHYIIFGGGHTWPGADTSRRLSKIVGPTSREVNATQEIERLFLSLALP